MKLRVKQRFLSYEIGDELPISLLVSNPKYYTTQIKVGNLEVITDKVETPMLEEKIPKKASKSVISRAKEYIEDLLDDGKRNYSNNPNKKSPGRKSTKNKIIKRK